MLGAGVVLFGFYFFLLLVEEMGFHRSRAMASREKVGHLLNLLSVMACFAFVVFVPYDPNSRMVYGALLMASLVIFSKDEFAHAGKSSPKEQWVRSWIYMFHPLTLIFAGALWPFVHGVSLFMGAVLPFKTDGLKTLCIGALCAFGVLFLYVLTGRGKKALGVAEPGVVASGS